MDLAIWIITGIVSIFFAIAGASKLFQGRQAFIDKLGPKVLWATKVSDTQFLLIGAVELIGAVALIGPKIIGVAEVVSLLATILLALLTVGAVLLHLGINDRPETIYLPSTLCSLCLILLLLQTI